MVGGWSNLLVSMPSFSEEIEDFSGYTDTLGYPANNRGTMVPSYGYQPTSPPLATPPAPVTMASSIYPYAISPDNPPTDYYPANPSSQPSLSRAPDWRLSLGAGLGYLPKYEGADVYRFFPLPVFSVAYKNKFFLNTRRGIGFNWHLTDIFSIGTFATYYQGRSEGDAAYLAGTGDIDPTMENGLFLELTMSDYTIEWNIKRDTLGLGPEGFTSTLGFTAFYPLTSTTHLTLGGNVTWADDDYMQHVFGISPLQATRSGLPRYTASSGIKDVKLYSNILYYLNPHWALTFNGSTSTLIGDAANSPIVQLGNENQYYGATGFIYSF